MYQDLVVKWSTVGTTNVDDLNCSQCLYAYVVPRPKEIVYIGKADRCTVLERWRGPDKAMLHDWAESEGISGVRIHVGFVSWGEGRRFSSAKLTDVESLLIHRLQLPGNVAYKTNRIARPSTRVRCVGDWPHKRKTFVDN